MARPSEYKQEVAEDILEQIMEGKSLRSICLQDGYPNRSTFMRWVSSVDGLRDQYELAKQEQAHYLVEQILDIADETTNDHVTDEGGNERVNSEAIQRSRLRVDARKWYSSKVLPKLYGDKITTEHTGSVGVSDMTGEQLDQRIAAMLESATDAG